MTDISTIIVSLALGVFLLAVPAVLYFIFQELQAIREVLQARWDYDRFNMIVEVRDVMSIPSQGERVNVLHKRLYALLQMPHELGDMPPVPCPRRLEPEDQDSQP